MTLVVGSTERSAWAPSPEDTPGNGEDLLKAEPSFNHPSSGPANDASVPYTCVIQELKKSQVYAISGDVTFLAGSASNIEVRIYGSSTANN
jgi:hypothetical protein